MDDRLSRLQGDELWPTPLWNNRYFATVAISVFTNNETCNIALCGRCTLELAAAVLGEMRRRRFSTMDKPSTYHFFLREIGTCPPRCLLPFESHGIQHHSVRGSHKVPWLYPVNLFWSRNWSLHQRSRLGFAPLHDVPSTHGVASSVIFGRCDASLGCPAYRKIRRSITFLHGVQQFPGLTKLAEPASAVRDLFLKDSAVLLDILRSSTEHPTCIQSTLYAQELLWYVCIPMWTIQGSRLLHPKWFR